MPPPGYRAATSRQTPTEKLVVDSPAPQQGGWVGDPEPAAPELDAAELSVLSADDAPANVRRQLLGAEGDSPPDGPTDSPTDSPPNPTSRTPTADDAEEARLDAQLKQARRQRQAAEKDARKRREIESGGSVSWIRLSRLYNSQGFLSPKRSRFLRRHPALEIGLRLCILAALLLAWVGGTIFAPALTLGVAPAGPFPLPSSTYIVDLLPLSFFRHPQVRAKPPRRLRNDHP